MADSTRRTTAPVPPAPFDADWDAELGLWAGGDGKNNPDAHSIRYAAEQLTRAGCLGLLGAMPAERVFDNLRRAQAGEGDARGNFWWAWEDGEVTDKNSGFFTTIQLLALRNVFAEWLPSAARSRLDGLLREAAHWFSHKVEPPTENKLRYPNAFLGDAICLWLIRECAGGIDDAWRATFRRILAYYRDEHWGWGEHLSDGYAKVCQAELTALLLWGHSMDEETRALARERMGELVAIDRAFAGGPRTPAIRSYQLDASPGSAARREWQFYPFAELMRREGPESVSGCQRLFAHLAAREGLSLGEPPPPPATPARSVECHGGSRALAWVTPRYRYGGMTRYPLFPDTNRSEKWGLAWQSMPVAFWHADGDWGYLQWAAEENGQVHAHPGLSRRHTQVNRLCRLSDEDPGACHGWTSATRHEDAFLVLREMPKIAASWTWLADRFRLISPSASAAEVDETGSWHRLTLRYPQETATIACRALDGDAKVAFDRAEALWHFGLTLDLAENAPAPARWRALWFITVRDEPAEPPRLILDDPGKPRAVFSDGTEQCF